MINKDAGKSYLNQLERDIEKRAHNLRRAVSIHERKAMGGAYLAGTHTYALYVGGVPVADEPHETMLGSTAKALNEAYKLEFQRVAVEEFRSGIPFRESKAKMAKWVWLKDKEAGQ